MHLSIALNRLKFNTQHTNKSGSTILNDLNVTFKMNNSLIFDSDDFTHT